MYNDDVWYHNMPNIGKCIKIKLEWDKDFLNVTHFYIYIYIRMCLKFYPTCFSASCLRSASYEIPWRFTMFSWYEPRETIVLASSISKSMSQVEQKRSWILLEFVLPANVVVEFVSSVLSVWHELLFFKVLMAISKLKIQWTNH